MITLITGNHPRHKYLADCFVKFFKDVVWIIEKRENFVPEIDKNFKIENQKLQKYHFEKRENAELEFFSSKAGELAKNNINKIFEINKENLNSKKIKRILEKEQSKILITYGCHKISDDILKVLKGYKWNIHGGLSPWYKGNITHFWPTYMLEPEYTGMTLHDLTSDIDGGSVIHQQVSDLNINDGIHENACRLVKSFFDQLPEIINNNLGKKLIGIKNKTTGRIWTSKMWTPLHLNLIYNFYNDKINKYCLENKKIIKPIIKSILI
jgi:folate-dependent phosphoribosylglycinamide formyltransferase PurN